LDLEALKARLADTSALRPVGRVVAVTGLTVRLAMPGARVGDVVIVKRRGEPLYAEVVGFQENEAVAAAMGELSGVGPDDSVESTGGPLQVAAGSGLIGRVLDGLGRPVDGQPLPRGLITTRLNRAPPPALTRRRVDKPLSSGVRAIDAMLTLGVGQRVGLFAGSGVGKSTLLSMMARGASADVVVVALVGERGREVGDFIDQALGAEGRKRTVMVVATSDAPALERLRAAQVATAIAEHFRDEGATVLLLVDSVTRIARAQREIGLAAGEPPTRRGYPPSVFAMLPRLLERSGQADKGSITALYTVLVEGDDLEEPIADEVRGILDGHIVLDRDIFARGHYPAIDISASLSRVMDGIVGPDHRAAAGVLRELISRHEQNRDLIGLGAYKSGVDARIDRAISAMPDIERLLRQPARECVSFEEAVAQLRQIASRWG
jgi:type III secretion protein N (ATPase)